MPKNLTFVALVRNRPGVLTRVAGMFRRRLFNIESLTVGHSEQEGLSRMTIGVDSSISPEMVTQQLYKLVDIVHVANVSESETVFRELALIKVACPPEKRTEIFPLIENFRGKIVDIAVDSIIVEATGVESKVDTLIQLLTPYGVREIVRTGRVAMVRGIKTDEEAVDRSNQIRAIG